MGLESGAVEPSSRVVLVVNPASDKGRAPRAAPSVVQAFQDRGFEVVTVIGSSFEDALERLRAAVAAAPTRAVISCGGDGTVHLCLQVVAGTDLPLAMVAAGSGNDNATMHGSPADPGEAARLLADALVNDRIAEVDAGFAVSADGVERWYLGVLSSGFDSLVNERANAMSRPSGHSRYLVAILAELRVFKAVPYVMVLDEGLVSESRHEKRGMLVAVGNGSQYGGGMKVCPNASFDDGALSVTFLDELSTATFLRVFPTVYKGTHIRRPEVHEHTASTVRLDAPGQVAYADGERIGPLPVEIRVVPRAVRILVPETTPPST
jgi:diacylglycerol kinase (ATP)